ncbi:unnamed protein product [Callosobruchus maculatus]|uniref:DUF4200 domain-containing protein n=1 Tax=Callosobruchus maculatus TaxID=64391 RepID=A0A653C081_CALMS|nr:unnamed protein product [Callosobruchus maculatus]
MERAAEAQTSESEMVEQLQALYESTSSLEQVPDFDHTDIEEQAKRRFRQRARHFSQQKEIFFDKRKYFTDNPRINDENCRNLQNEPSWYGYSKDMEQFAQNIMIKAWRNDVRIKELAMKCQDKPSYQGRFRLDMANRLYVKEPEHLPMKTVLDVDSKYFNTIEGRPNPERFNLREYIDTVRETLRIKIAIGYRDDDIMLIDENLMMEQKMINIISANYQNYVNAFEEFLFKDHHNSMIILEECEETSALAIERYEEYKMAAKKYSAMKSALYFSEEKWRDSKMYQEFLFNMSPVRFRLAHPKQSKDVDTIAEDVLDDDIFAKYRVALDDVELTLGDIKKISDECQNAADADIYFKEPGELVEVFRYMELQNLNNLLYCEELAAPLESVKNNMAQAEKMFDKEIASLSEIIGRLEFGIMWEEERAKYLEEFAKKLINEELKQLVVDENVLNLYVFVEDCFETRVAPNDANLTMLEMISGISKKYGDELLAMEKVPKEIISVLGESCVQENMATMRLAEKAAKQVAELQRLTASLIKTFAPPYQKPPCKEPKNRSPVKKPPALKKVPSRKLTPEEEEYLEYFTDFCKFTDNPKDFGIDTSVMRKLNRYQVKGREEGSEERIVFGAPKSAKSGKK